MAHGARACPRAAPAGAASAFLENVMEGHITICTSRVLWQIVPSTFVEGLRQRSQGGVQFPTGGKSVGSMSGTVARERLAGR